MFIQITDGPVPTMLDVYLNKFSWGQVPITGNLFMFRFLVIDRMVSEDNARCGLCVCCNHPKAVHGVLGCNAYAEMRMPGVVYTCDCNFCHGEVQ